MLIDIDDTLEAKQEVVGGDIEPLYLDNGCVIIANEDGIGYLPFNRIVYPFGKEKASPVIIAGNFFVMNDDWSDYESTDMTDFITSAAETEEIIRRILRREAP